MCSPSNDLNIKTVCNIQSHCSHCGGQNRRIVTIRFTYVTSSRLYSRNEKTQGDRCSHFQSLTSFSLAHLPSSLPTMHFSLPSVLPIIHHVHIRTMHITRFELNLVFCVNEYQNGLAQCENLIYALELSVQQFFSLV